MGTEAVHRALALQSLGLLGNDRASMKYSQPEENPNDPFFPKAGFRRIESAVAYLEAAGFGFGKAGSKPGQIYDFDQVRARTPDPKESQRPRAALTRVPASGRTGGVAHAWRRSVSPFAAVRGPLATAKHANETPRCPTSVPSN